MNARMAIDRKDRLAKKRRRWAVGNVNTGSEIKVAKRLGADGLEVYCPRFEMLRRRQWHKRERETVEKAVLPGYLFVNAETIRNEEAIYDVADFHMFLRYAASGAKKLLHDDAIERLRALEKKGIIKATSIEALIAQFAAGDLVKVCEGSFGGLVGEVVSVDKGRVTVEGQDFTHPTELPAENLKLES